MDTKSLRLFGPFSLALSVQTMNFDVDPKAMETINALMSNPYAIAGKWVFGLFVLILFVMTIKRHRMSVPDAMLAMVGIKRVQNRDALFNIIHVLAIAVPLTLFFIAMQSQG